MIVTHQTAVHTKHAITGDCEAFSHSEDLFLFFRNSLNIPKFFGGQTIVFKTPTIEICRYHNHPPLL